MILSGVKRSEGERGQVITYTAAPPYFRSPGVLVHRQPGLEHLGSSGSLTQQFSKDVLRHTGVWQPEARNAGQWFMVILKGPEFVKLSKQRNDQIQGKPFKCHCQL